MHLLIMNRYNYNYNSYLFINFINWRFRFIIIILIQLLMIIKLFTQLNFKVNFININFKYFVKFMHNINYTIINLFNLN